MPFEILLMLPKKRKKKRRKKLSYGKDSNSLAKAIFTFYQTALEATRQTYWIGLLFKHTTKKSHSDFGAISVPKRCCASAIFEMQYQVSFFQPSSHCKVKVHTCQRHKRPEFISGFRRWSKPSMKQTQDYYYSPLDGMLVPRRVTPSS